MYLISQKSIQIASINNSRLQPSIIPSISNQILVAFIWNRATKYSKIAGFYTITVTLIVAFEFSSQNPCTLRCLKVQIWFNQGSINKECKKYLKTIVKYSRGDEFQREQQRDFCKKTSTIF